MFVSLHKLTYVLVIVGALNWGLVGLFGFNLVSTLFGYSATVENLVYILVGVSAVAELMNHGRCCSDCCSTSMVEVKKKKKR
jgi:hypothetical protein